MFKSCKLMAAFIAILFISSSLSSPVIFIKSNKGSSTTFYLVSNEKIDEIIAMINETLLLDYLKK